MDCGVTVDLDVVRLEITWTGGPLPWSERLAALTAQQASDQDSVPPGRTITSLHSALVRESMLPCVV